MTEEAELDHYAVLGVPADADRAEIGRAYRRKALTHHPDKGGDAGVFRGLHLAYETLTDPVRRAAYDRRRTRTPSTGARWTQAEPPPAADPFAWAPGAGPVADDRRVHSVPFPEHDPGVSWRRADRFAWWRPVEEPWPKRRRRRR
ncbi:J domain-containing protein [Streptomyces sp. NPDC055036]